MHIVVFNPREIKLIEQCERILHVDVVVCYSVHDEESNVLREILNVSDGSVIIASGVVLRRVHVALGVDRVYISRLAGHVESGE